MIREGDDPFASACCARHLLLALMPLAVLTVLGTLVLVPALIAHGEERNRESSPPRCATRSAQLELRDGRRPSWIAGAPSAAPEIDAALGGSIRTHMQVPTLVDDHGLVTHAAC